MMVIVWIVIPIPSRAIDNVGRQPEPIKYYGTNYVARYEYIVIAINITIADDSHCCRGFVFAFDNDRSHVLI